MFGVWDKLIRHRQAISHLYLRSIDRFRLASTESLLHQTAQPTATLVGGSTVPDHARSEYHRGSRGNLLLLTTARTVERQALLVQIRQVRD